MMRERKFRKELGEWGPAMDPKDVGVLLAEISSMLPKILKNYSWAHEAAYGVSGAGVGERGSRSSTDASLRLLEGLQQPDRKRAGEAASRACDLLTDAVKALRKAQGTTARAFPKHRLTLRQGYEQVFPKTAFDSEVKESKDAQRRREGRGEGYGRA